MGEIYIMKRLFLTGTLSSILFLTACGGADETAEQTAENDNSSEENQQVGEDTVEKEKLDEKENESPVENS